MTGKKFGRLLVLEKAPDRITNSGRRKAWKCLCDCGNIVDITTHSLQSGTISCGCYNKEINRNMRLTHVTHGDSKSRLYNIWAHIKQRCNNPNDKNYANYGGRGIKVYPEWNDYPAFKEWSINNGYDDTLSIDRIDVNGNYYPENCRWTNAFVQGNNKRNTIFIEYNGKRKTLSEWGKILGIPSRVLYARYTSNKWTEKEIIEMPYKTKPIFQGKKVRITDVCKEHNISYSTVSYRLKQGWSLEEAILTPLRSKPVKSKILDGQISFDDLMKEGTI